MKTEITETIEIPSILKKELEPIAKKQGQDFKAIYFEFNS